jgi:Dolichyl-phosphate-mannose-protein mannosyltransferase
MPRDDDWLARSLVAAAVAFILVAVAVAITGGGSIQLGKILLRSHDPIRPLLAAALLLGITAWRGTATVPAAFEWHWQRLERHAAGAAAVLSIAAVLAAFHWGAFIAGGSDSYCYLNQAELLARGAVHDYEPLSEDPAWPGNPWSFAPAGHIPMGAPAPALVPICPAGYPLLMAGARRLAGRNAMFWITPLMGGLAVYLAFLLGRRLDGSAAGLLTAALTLSSPTFLIQLFQPMNDVTAAALWCAALVAAMQEERSDLARALFSGVLTATAITVRPNLLPLAVAIGVGLALLVPGRTVGQRLAIVGVFGLASVPGALVVMALQNAMYGSPFKSGYGDLDTLFSVAHVTPNLQRYARWLIEAQTPIIAAALLSPWLLTWPRGRRYAIWLIAFAAITLACYLPYVVFDAWWYTRFLLPATLPLLALTAGVTVTLIARGAPAPARLIVFGLLTTALVAFSIRTAVARDVFRIRDLEWRFRSAGERVAALPATAALITLHHSGSVRFYSGRSTLGWADIEKGHLDGAIAFLRRHGRKPYLMFEGWEEPQFKERFAGERLGALDWPPFAEVDGVKLYDPDDYDRHLRGERIVTERVVTPRR